MFIGPNSPNHQPDLNLPHMGIPPVNPAELPPEMGSTMYPGDETGGVAEGLAPPATSGAEQDMQTASLEHHLGVSATSGAQETTAASDEPDGSQPAQTPADITQTPESAKYVDDAPQITFVSGGDGPNDPPDTPEAPSGNLFPEREPIVAPDLNSLSERPPYHREAVRAALALQLTIASKLAEYEDYTTLFRMGSETGFKSLNLRVPTTDGYMSLDISGQQLTVERSIFQLPADTSDHNTSMPYPAEIYRYGLVDVVGGTYMSRERSMRSTGGDATDMSLSELALKQLDEHVKTTDLLRAMPTLDTRTVLNVDEAIAVIELLEHADVATNSFQNLRTRTLGRASRDDYEVSDIDAIDAAVDLRTIVEKQFQRTEYSATDSPDTKTWRTTARAHPDYDDREAHTAITVGYEEVEPPDVIDLLADDSALRIPDTVEDIDHSTPPKTPFITVEVDAQLDDEGRQVAISSLNDRNITPQTDLRAVERHRLSLQDGKLVVTYGWDLKIDGVQETIVDGIDVKGDLTDIYLIRHYLRNPRYYSEVADWFARYKANQQNPETPQ